MGLSLQRAPDPGADSRGSKQKKPSPSPVQPLRLPKQAGAAAPGTGRASPHPPSTGRASPHPAGGVSPARRRPSLDVKSSEVPAADRGARRSLDMDSIAARKGAVGGRGSPPLEPAGGKQPHPKAVAPKDAAAATQKTGKKPSVEAVAGGRDAGGASSGAARFGRRLLSLFGGGGGFKSSSAASTAATQPQQQPKPPQTHISAGYAEGASAHGASGGDSPQLLRTLSGSGHTQWSRREATAATDVSASHLAHTLTADTSLPTSQLYDKLISSELSGSTAPAPGSAGTAGVPAAAQHRAPAAMASPDAAGKAGSDQSKGTRFLHTVARPAQNPAVPQPPSLAQVLAAAEAEAQLPLRGGSRGGRQRRSSLDFTPALPAHLRASLDSSGLPSLTALGAAQEVARLRSSLATPLTAGASGAVVRSFSPAGSASRVRPSLEFFGGTAPTGSLRGETRTGGGGGGHEAAAAGPGSAPLPVMTGVRAAAPPTTKPAAAVSPPPHGGAPAAAGSPVVGWRLRALRQPCSPTTACNRTRTGTGMVQSFPDAPAAAVAWASGGVSSDPSGTCADALATEREAHVGVDSGPAGRGARRSEVGEAAQAAWAPRVPPLATLHPLQAEPITGIAGRAALVPSAPGVGVAALRRDAAVSQGGLGGGGGGDVMDYVGRGRLQAQPDCKALRLAKNAISVFPGGVLPLVAKLQLLDLTGNKLSGVPGDLTRCSGLRTLLLSHNSLAGVPDAVFGLVRLRRLELARCGLADVDGAWFQLTALKSRPTDANALSALVARRLGAAAAVYVADVRHNAWRSVPAEVLRLNGLVVLNASDNDIESLADGVTPQHLGVLNLSFNRLASLPAALGAAPVLQQMYLANNRLADLPRTFACLPMVDLFLSENEFEKVPVAVLGMSQLAKLSMACCRLAEGVGEMRRLEGLQLEGCPLPPTEAALYAANPLLLVQVHNTALTSLDLSGLGLDKVPKLDRLLGLTALDLSHNRLTRPPTELLPLTQLATLSLRDNPLVQPYAALLEAQFGSLSTVVLDHNCFTELPPVLGRLPKLSILMASSNPLPGSPLTPELLGGGLSRLQALLCGCVGLRLLDLSHNALRALPSGLGALSRLKSLKLHHNALPSVPRGLSCLGALTELLLSHNPLPLQVGARVKAQS
eukprot:XP_001699392.1 predicted protein [Chlamydomonas reinhardtii]